MKLYSTAEAAEILGVCRETVFRWIKIGKLQASQKYTGRMVYKIDQAQLLNFKLKEVDVALEVLNTTTQVLKEINQKLLHIRREQKKISRLLNQICPDKTNPAYSFSSPANSPLSTVKKLLEL